MENLGAGRAAGNLAFHPLLTSQKMFPSLLVECPGQMPCGTSPPTGPCFPHHTPPQAWTLQPGSLHAARSTECSGEGSARGLEVGATDLSANHS